MVMLIPFLRSPPTKKVELGYTIRVYFDPRWDASVGPVGVDVTNEEYKIEADPAQFVEHLERIIDDTRKFALEGLGVSMGKADK
jgi:hypothetical protein|tara:strand:- start:9405 stop:9656 length:252 start_codon:yes stop_codon:yes gene_type:complete